MNWQINKKLILPIKITNPSKKKLLIIKDVIHSFKKISLEWPNGMKASNNYTSFIPSMLHIWPKDSKSILFIKYFSETVTNEYGFIYLKTDEDDLIVIPVLINVKNYSLNTFPGFINFGLCDLSAYNRKNFVVAIDTANGATSVAAKKVFSALGIKHYVLNNTPNGININENCGSTHLDMIKKYVVENKCNIGIAYDGDGDRCLAIDENGNEIDGDQIIAIVSNYLKAQGKLANDTIVTTVMSNLGLRKYAEENGIENKQTKVGDRYVLEEMLKNGYNLGGEQSGHIIMLDYNPTGDGILTSLMVIKVMLETGKKASELASIMKKYPQVLINAKVKSEKKNDYEKDPEIQEAIKKLEEEFSGNGRVLIRPSGTEPLVRVMIEGENKEYIKEKAEDLAKLIENKLN